MDSSTVPVSAFPTAVRITLDTKLDYTFGSRLTVSIFFASLFFGVLLNFLRRRNPKTRVGQDLWLDLCTTSVQILSITLALTRWLEFTLVGSAVASDFTQDYVAALAIRHGTNLYGEPFKLFAAHTFQFEIMNPQPEVLNFHPAFNAVMFLPISFIPYKWAFIYWNIVSTWIYVVIVYLLLKVYGIATFRCMQICTILLVWEPFANTMASGQISIILAGFIIGGFLLTEYYGRPSLGGFLFGLATLIKLFPGLIILYLFLRRRWYCVTVMIVTVVAGLLLTVAIVGVEQNLFYIRSILPEQLRLFDAYPFNISVESVVRTIFDRTNYSVPAFLAPQLISGVTLLINGLLVLPVFLVIYINHTHERCENLFVLICLTMLLATPITWPHTAIIILLAMAILLRQSLIFGRRGLFIVLALVLLTFSIPVGVLVRDVVASYPAGKVPWYVLLSAKPGLFGLFILWVIFARNFLTRRPSSFKC